MIFSCTWGCNTDKPQSLEEGCWTGDLGSQWLELSRMAFHHCKEERNYWENGKCCPVCCGSNCFLVRGMPWQEDVKRYQKNASFFRNAPACIGMFIRHYESVADKVLIARESFDHEAQEILVFRRSAPTAIQSAAAAVTTMLLVFHQMGLGAVWLVSPVQAKKEIETILETPANMALLCLIAVGYPDESPQKDRKPVDQVVEFI